MSKTYYCSCHTKTHKSYREVEVDSEGTCVHCGYYARLSDDKVYASAKNTIYGSKWWWVLRNKELTDYIIETSIDNLRMDMYDGKYTRSPISL